MQRVEFKKLLLDLGLSVAEIGREVDLSRAAVWKYVDGELRDPDRRRSIQACLDAIGRERDVVVPRIWVLAASPAPASESPNSRRGGCSIPATPQGA
jgi:hypothetical protein